MMRPPRSVGFHCLNALFEPGKDSALGDIGGPDAQAGDPGSLLAALALDGEQPEGLPGGRLKRPAHLLCRQVEDLLLAVALPALLLFLGRLFFQQLESGTVAAALLAPLPAAEKVVDL